MKEKINSIIMLGGTFLTYIMGTFDTVLIITVTFMGFDYLSGILAGTKNNQLDSKIGIQGVKKKAFMLIYIIVGTLLDRLINNGNWTFRTLMCFYIIGTEGISILENGGKLGVPYPKKLFDVLNQLKEKEE